MVARQASQDRQGCAHRRIVYEPVSAEAVPNASTGSGFIDRSIERHRRIAADCSACRHYHVIAHGQLVFGRHRHREGSMGLPSDRSPGFCGSALALAVHFCFRIPDVPPQLSWGQWPRVLSERRTWYRRASRQSPTPFRFSRTKPLLPPRGPRLCPLPARQCLRLSMLIESLATRFCPP